MAALTKDSIFRFLGSPTKASFLSNQAATVPFFAGSLVYTDTGGGVQSLPAAGDTFVGICPKYQAVAVGAEVEVLIDGMFLLPTGAAIAAADEGDLLVMDVSDTLTDNPADCESNLDAVGVTNDIGIGRIYRVTSEGMWVMLEPHINASAVPDGWV